MSHEAVNPDQFGDVVPGLSRIARRGQDRPELGEWTPEATSNLQAAAHGWMRRQEAQGRDFSDEHNQPAVGDDEIAAWNDIIEQAKTNIRRNYNDRRNA